MSQHRSLRSLIVVLALSAACVARAAVQQSVETNVAPAGPLTGAPYTPTFVAGGPSSTVRHFVKS